LAQAPSVFIVCSGQHRNGKTLLARVLVDFLMLEGRDPFVLDADAAHNPLRSFFPGRTAVVDFTTIAGQMRLFDTILNSPGRDYVIDLPAPETGHFFDTAGELRVFDEFHRLGFRVIVLFIVDKDKGAPAAADALARRHGIDLVVPVRNLFIGSAWAAGHYALTLPALDQTLVAAIENRRFSLRAFAQGEAEGLDERQQAALLAFLTAVMNDLRDLGPVLSLKKLKG
jgi:hypothetical protein